MSCAVGCRRSSDPTLLWLWRRPVAMAPIRPLVWESPYAEGAALEKAKRQKEEKKRKRKMNGKNKQMIDDLQDPYKRSNIRVTKDQKNYLKK